MREPLGRLLGAEEGRWDAEREREAMDLWDEEGPEPFFLLSSMVFFAVVNVWGRIVCNVGVWAGWWRCG